MKAVSYTHLDVYKRQNKDRWIQESIGIENTGMWSSNTGTNASFTFTGTKAWIVGTLDPSHGIMEVWIDDEKVSEVDKMCIRDSLQGGDPFGRY